ncbi:MAG: hypothetical protein CMJ89_19225 [Planctomycetes bacterium]|nr:hypothetical protein [Planctomycetota bacterium]
MAEGPSRRRVLAFSALTGAAAFGGVWLAGRTIGRTGSPALWGADGAAGEVLLFDLELSILRRIQLPGLRRIFGAGSGQLWAWLTPARGAQEVLRLGLDGDVVDRIPLEGSRDVVASKEDALFVLSEGGRVSEVRVGSHRSCLSLPWADGLCPFGDGILAFGEGRIVRFATGRRTGIVASARFEGRAVACAPIAGRFFLTAQRGSETEVLLLNEKLRSEFALRLSGEMLSLTADRMGNAWGLLTRTDRLVRIASTGRVDVSPPNVLPHGACLLRWSADTLFVALWGAVLRFDGAADWPQPLPMAHPQRSQGGFSRLVGLVPIGIR